MKKGEFSPGDLCVYFEIDSWVPHKIAPFLTQAGNSPRVYEGVEGERLRTIKLKGQLSQGLALPLGTPGDTRFPEVWQYIFDNHIEEAHLHEHDLSDLLGVKKWEDPVTISSNGVAIGSFPLEVPKTDQERIQNLSEEFEIWKSKGLVFEVTEKLDGTSCTFYLDQEGIFHVCSRNLDLKFDENNALWNVALRYGIEERMNKLNLKGHAIQGELIGERIQGNKYGIKGQDFFAFDVYSVSDGKYLSSKERIELCQELQIPHVPLVDTKKITASNIQEILQEAEGKSALVKDASCEREGLVWKCVTDTSISFKVISNKWLLKNKE